MDNTILDYFETYGLEDNFWYINSSIKRMWQIFESSLSVTVRGYNYQDNSYYNSALSQSQLLK